ncbi:MAG: hypothetical protein ACT4QG_05590 [Sporichthyaceae bacterium]
MPQPADWTRTVRRARETSTGALLLSTFVRSVDELHDAALDELPDAIAEALARVAPNVDPDTLASYPDSALAGLANAVKGALFELQVAEAVASGVIDIPAGSTFHLVEDFSTPGYDAVLTLADGTEELVQIKASATADIIERHLAHHPDVETVWTTSEAAADAAARGLSADDTGISNDALNAATGALAEHGHLGFGDLVDETLPQVALALIGAQAGWRLLQGEAPRDVLNDSLARAREATVTSALCGVLATATGTDAVRIPAVVAIGVGRAAVAESRGIAERIALLAEVAAGLRPRAGHP